MRETSFRELYHGYRELRGPTHLSKLSHDELVARVSMRLRGSTMSTEQMAQYAILIGYLLAREDVATETSFN